MSKPTLQDIQYLLHHLIIPFYQIERDMPLPVDSYRNENDAEHSWSLVVLAVALAPEIDPALDVGKVCIFAVIHDIVEIHAGDTSAWGPAHLLESKARREEEAVLKIQQQFTAFPHFVKTIEAYERKDTAEALFVYALDKFINLLMRTTDNGKYYQKQKITLEQFQKRIKTHKKKAHSHPEVAKYYDGLLAIFNAHPEYFYQGVIA